MNHQQQEYKLEYDNLLKLPRYKWFEYTLPFTVNTSDLQWIQLSVEDYFIDVVCFLFLNFYNNIINFIYIYIL
jgi:hypothetical protein